MKILLKDVFCGNFLLFVLQLSWFKTYPHADAKQRKTKKWPYVEKMKILLVYEMYFQNELDLESVRLENIHSV
jgi:hypothetical protein